MRRSEAIAGAVDPQDRSDLQFPPVMQSEQSELIEELLRSKSFLEWSPSPKPTKPQTITAGRGPSFSYAGKTYANRTGPFSYTGGTYTNLIVDERHYSPAELAKAWGVSAETVRQLFRSEPGVLRLGTNGDKQTRGYITLRIPQSVATRVHTRLTALPQTR